MSHIHIGVYGLCVHQGSVLLIKKSRGPYTGMYDLPGGSIEFGESIQQCLIREMMEETQTQVIESSFLSNNEYICEYVGSSGDKKQSHHIGIYYQVRLNSHQVKQGADGHDSLGAEWIPVQQIPETSIAPIAKQIIEKYALVT